MSKFSHFLKVLRSHIFMILLIGILCGGIAASYIYYFYNPKNVTYEITFKSNENINLSLDYIVNVKNIIEKERINGEYINEKGEVRMREEKYQPKMPDIMEAIFDAGYLIFDLVAAILFFT